MAYVAVSEAIMQSDVHCGDYFVSVIFEIGQSNAILTALWGPDAVPGAPLDNMSCHIDIMWAG